MVSCMVSRCAWAMKPKLWLFLLLCLVLSVYCGDESSNGFDEEDEPQSSPVKNANLPRKHISCFFSPIAESGQGSGKTAKFFTPMTKPKAPTCPKASSTTTTAPQTQSLFGTGKGKNKGRPDHLLSKGERANRRKATKRKAQRHAEKKDRLAARDADKAAKAKAKADAKNDDGGYHSDGGRGRRHPRKRMKTISMNGQCKNYRRVWSETEKAIVARTMKDYQASFCRRTGTFKDDTCLRPAIKSKLQSQYPDLFGPGSVCKPKGIQTCDIASILTSVRNAGNYVLLFDLSVCPSVCLCVCLSVCLSVGLSVCLSVYLSVCLSVCLCVCVCLSVCLSVCVSVCVSVSLSVCLSVCPSLCLSVYLSVRLSICLSVYLSVYLSVRLFVC